MSTKAVFPDVPRTVVLYQRVVRAGAPTVELFVLHCPMHDGSVEPFAPLIEYFIESAMTRRMHAQREMARSLSLLFDFLAATGQDRDALDTDALRRFAETLLAGTDDASSLMLRSLGWPSRSHKRAACYLGLVTRFTDWLSPRLGKLAPNAWRDATPAERLAATRRQDVRASHALLAHAAYRVHDARAATKARPVSLARSSMASDGGDAPAFDPSRLSDLLLHGFAVKAPKSEELVDRVDLRDVLITLLLHGGGLRVGEPFHLYVGDVMHDPNEPGLPLVRLFHPDKGAPPSELHAPWANRRAYLRDRWNWKPRNCMRGRFRAGWKNLAISDARVQSAQVLWYPVELGRLFLHLLPTYLARRPPAAHPFLFVSERGPQAGEPYTVKAFYEAHAVAVRRIGLVPAKHLGTTPHGHRHAYGAALARAGLKARAIQRAMHHRSMASQAVYTLPPTAEIARALSAASARLTKAHLDILSPAFQELIDETQSR